GMDGFEALEPLRAARRRKGAPLPIIVLTGKGDHDTLIRLYRAGADYFVSKPYREDELLRGIRMALPASGREIPAAVTSPTTRSRESSPS
ncbi:MAG: response regulator, partial [Candidatus Binatia bacterium]